MDDPFPAGMVDEWQRILTSRNNQVSGSSDDVFGSGLVFPLQRRAELKRMLDIATSLGPQTVMEIGADKGGGLYHWCQLPTVKNVIACEVRGTPYRHAFEDAFPRINFLWLEGSSLEKAAVWRVQHFLDQRETSLDVLFIDGDKSYFDVDFWHYSTFMRPGSVAFFHDITDLVPGAGYQRVLQAMPDCRHEEIIDRSDADAALDRAMRGIPSANAYEAWLRYWKGASCGVGVIYL